MTTLNKQIFSRFFDNYTGSGYQADSLVLEVDVGGASGGNCYGDYAKEYSKEPHEIEEAILEAIEESFRTLVYQCDLNDEELLAQAVKTVETLVNDYDTRTDGGDCYGNSTTYHIYKINVVEFMEPVMPPDLFQEFKQFANVYKEKEENIAYNNQLLQTEKTLTRQIKSFNADSTREENSLKVALKKARQEVIQLERKLIQFDDAKAKEKNSLEKRLIDTQKLILDVNEADKPSETKKPLKLK